MSELEYNDAVKEIYKLIADSPNKNVQLVWDKMCDMVADNEGAIKEWLIVDKN